MSIRLENGARAQIELDLDNTRESNARMSERYYLEDRYKIEGRLVFIDYLENKVQTEDEGAILSSYKEICQKILTARLHISKHKREIKHYEQINQNAAERTPYQKSDYGKTMIGFSEREISKATESLNDLEQQALNLEKNEVIQKLYYRAYVAAAAESKYDLAKLLEEKRNSFERPQPSLPKKQETIKESKTPPTEPEPIVTPPEEEKTGKHVWASIPFSLLGLFEYYIIYGLSVLAIAFVFLLLSYIPIINTLVDWLLRIGENTPDMFAMMFGVTLAYLGTTATAEHIVKGTRKHALMLTGIYLVVLNIIFLIVNLVNNDAILPNVIIGIAGVVMFYKNKDE